MSILRIKKVDFLLFWMMLTVFKCYIFPESVRKIGKFVFLIVLFIFLVKRMNRKQLKNISILFALSMFLSSAVNYFSNALTVASLIETIAQSIMFYEIYTLIEYYALYDDLGRGLRCIYNANLLFCILTIISVLIVGTENNSNSAVYIFGTKFSSSYLFLFLIATYATTHTQTLMKNRIITKIFALFTTMFSLYVGCSTTTVCSMIILLALCVPQRLWKYILNAKVLAGFMAFSAYSFVLFNQLLSIPFIHNIFFGIFNKTTTIYGRIQIYETYLMNIIQLKPIWGYGYNNGIMYSVSKGVFNNAQNGVMDQMIGYGAIGVILLFYLTFFCINRGQNNSNSKYFILFIFTLIIASVVETTINWFFFIGIFLVRWSGHLKSEQQT